MLLIVSPFLIGKGGPQKYTLKKNVKKFGFMQTTKFFSINSLGVDLCAKIRKLVHAGHFNLNDAKG